jgi:hypothetical protein
MSYHAGNREELEREERKEKRTKRGWRMRGFRD